MSFFAVYDPATGAILRFGSCVFADLARQAQVGEAVIATAALAPDNRFRIDIAKTPPVAVAIAAPLPA